MVRCVPVKGYFAENCFFYIDEETRHGFVIDPGAEAQRLLAIIRREGWVIEAILLTHGHFDHTGAVDELRDTCHIPAYAYENADRYLMDGEMNLSSFCIGERVVKDVRPLRAGESICLQNGACRLRVIHTPGHTTDSVVYYSEKDHVAFVGDTIFRGSMIDIRAAIVRNLQKVLWRRYLPFPMTPFSIPATRSKRPSGRRKEDIVRIPFRNFPPVKSTALRLAFHHDL